MIVLDTNIVSELMKPDGEPAVYQWAAKQPRTGLFTTTITMAEVFYGLELLSRGRKRLDLTAAATSLFEEIFKDRVLPFDTDAATVYPAVAASRRKIGRPISPFDAQIAAIARSRGAALATRNTADFEFCELTLINPWQSK